MRKNKFIRRKQEATKNTILLLILILGLGYALIQSNLTINGSASLNNPTWDIHWNNVQVQEGSVTGTNVVTAPTIDTPKTTVTYSIILSKPGDYYEFTVDAVNAGTIDGMIESITSKLNGSTITTLPAYLEYTVSYSDDVPLAVNQLLAAGTTETYKVKVKYSEDININQIPSTNQTLSLQFTIKYKQADENAIEPNRLYTILKNAATEGTYAKKYTGNHHDSFTEEPSKDIYHWWADSNSNTDAYAVLDKNNVIFANFCWQMIRTTDTGGVKIVYNGVPSSGQCNNSGNSQQMGSNQFNSAYNSPAYAGYMYNPNTLITISDSAATSGSLFGTGVTYNGNTYTLTSTSTTYDATHHYTCNNTSGTCTNIRYYFYNNYYVEISNGKTIEQVLGDMLSADDVNQTNSVIKDFVDNWYANNMTTYTNKLEDTIFCNDRSISDLGGWNPNGGSTTENLKFKNNSYNYDLSCTNATDKFSLSNNKARLTYPVGLLTLSENLLLNNEIIRITGKMYWNISPVSITFSDVRVSTMPAAGGIANSAVTIYAGVRPAISLKPGTIYTSGDGSKNNPYIVE